ncbi:MAG: response regulator receiver protein [Frankiales bacterium]|jgi:two-component system OmpR family response regulator|nr:response regulator receiver protein [Frankiales bacterium]
MRILVVDDEPNVRRLLSVQLGLAGHEVDIAEDGAAALVSLGQHRPDVLVLDVMMPHVDGWGVLAALRSKPQFVDLPVILLTAKDQAEDVAHSWDLGASMVMSKPYDGDRLIAVIEAFGLQAEAVAQP